MLTTKINTYRNINLLRNLKYEAIPGPNYVWNGSELVYFSPGVSYDVSSGSRTNGFSPESRIILVSQLSNIFLLS